MLQKFFTIDVRINNCRQNKYSYASTTENESAEINGVMFYCLLQMPAAIIKIKSNYELTIVI